MKVIKTPGFLYLHLCYMYRFYLSTPGSSTQVQSDVPIAIQFVLVGRAGWLCDVMSIYAGVQGQYLDSVQLYMARLAQSVEHSTFTRVSASAVIELSGVRAPHWALLFVRVLTVLVPYTPSCLLLLLQVFVRSPVSGQNYVLLARDGGPLIQLP